MLHCDYAVVHAERRDSDHRLRYVSPGRSRLCPRFAPHNFTCLERRVVGIGEVGDNDGRVFTNCHFPFRAFNHCLDLGSSFIGSSFTNRIFPCALMLISNRPLGLVGENILPRYNGYVWQKGVEKYWCWLAYSIDDDVRHLSLWRLALWRLFAVLRLGNACSHQRK